MQRDFVMLLLRCISGTCICFYVICVFILLYYFVLCCVCFCFVVLHCIVLHSDVSVVFCWFHFTFCRICVVFCKVPFVVWLCCFPKLSCVIYIFVEVFSVTSFNVMYMFVN